MTRYIDFIQVQLNKAFPVASGAILGGIIRWQINNDLFVNLMGKSLTLTSAYMKKSNLFIGNDSGLMHLSAAAGINTIGLFGPTRDDWYRPYGEKCYVLRTKESFIELRKELKDSSKSLMSSITVDQVIELIMKKNII